MRRLAGIGALVAAVLVAVLTTGLSGTSGNYRVDALFDSADYLIAGQDVKIAGARVGEVEAVKLTRERKARVEMRIDPGFAPFRANASCTIRPQSLIGEKFVECEPGNPSTGVLARRGGVPTISVAHTHSPVDLDLVFTALRLPLRQRLSIVVNELGTGLVGHPHELSEAIRRANPALQQTTTTLRILNSERRTLGRLIDASDRVVGELAARRTQVADFIDRADAVARTVASRRGDLDLALRRLPPLLAELEPAAVDLTGLATDARPVVRALGAAAPPVRALLGDFDPLARATRPTLVKLAQLSDTGRAAVRASLPVARLLDPVARLLPPTVQIARPLVDSLRDHNVLEQIGAFAYYGAVSTARFDKVSHILPTYQIGGTCQQYAETPAAGCNAHFAGMNGGGAAELRKLAKQVAAAQAARGHGGPAAGAIGAAGPGAPALRTPAGRAALDAVKKLLDKARHPPPGAPPAQGIPQDLLDFLLKP